MFETHSARTYLERMEATEFKIALVRLGLSGTQAAEEMGLRPETISRFATGKKPVPRLVARYIELRLKAHGD